MLKERSQFGWRSWREAVQVARKEQDGGTLSMPNATLDAKRKSDFDGDRTFSLCGPETFELSPIQNQKSRKYISSLDPSLKCFYLNFVRSFILYIYSVT